MQNRIVFETGGVETMGGNDEKAAGKSNSKAKSAATGNASSQRATKTSSKAPGPVDSTTFAVELSTTSGGGERTSASGSTLHDEAFFHALDRQFKRTHLKSLGWKIKQIDPAHWHSLDSRDAKNMHIRSMLLS